MLENELILNLTKSDGGKFSTNSLEEAYEFCEIIAKSHYENFPVASIFLPKQKRKYIYPIYTFARIADDIADNKGINNRNELLAKIKNQLLNKTESNPLFLALADAIQKNNLDIDLFLNLIDAFEYDSNFKEFNDKDELFKYCNNSANPIGRLILALFDEDSNNNCELSDKICTALQLTNFWQDLSRDFKNNRNYIPIDLLEKHDVNINNVNFDNNKLENCLEELFTITEDLFNEGKKILNTINSKRLQFELKFIILGGESILNSCKVFKSKLLIERPKLNKLDFIFLFIKSILWK